MYIWSMPSTLSPLWTGLSPVKVDWCEAVRHPGQDWADKEKMMHGQDYLDQGGVWVKTSRARCHILCPDPWHDKLAKTKMQKERKSKKRNRKILNRTDNIQNQSDNQAKEVNSKCSRIRKKLRRTEKKQKYAPEAHPMILLCIRKAAERIFSRRNFIRKA